jgi:ferredoxin
VLERFGEASGRVSAASSLNRFQDSRQNSGIFPAFCSTFKYSPGPNGLQKTGTKMPKLSIHGVGEFEVAQGKRLISALVQDAGTDQLHACGGQARCTTCRVKFIDGEPEEMTQAEKNTLQAKSISEDGVRLSCQIACDHDMSVKLISRFEGSGRKDQGSPVADVIEPTPVWIDK